MKKAMLAYGVKIEEAGLDLSEIDWTLIETLAENEGYRLITIGDAVMNQEQHIVAIKVLETERLMEVGWLIPTPGEEEQVYELIKFCEERVGIPEARHGWWLCVSGVEDSRREYGDGRDP